MMPQQYMYHAPTVSSCIYYVFEAELSWFVYYKRQVICCVTYVSMKPCIDIRVHSPLSSHMHTHSGTLIHIPDQHSEISTCSFISLQS